jgi:cation:H+ antiporter
MAGERTTRPPVPLLAAAAVTVPGLVLGATAYLGAPAFGMPEWALAIVYGAAIIDGAFVLSWAAEAAQVDLSAGLSLAILALMAILPEYAVDFVFTFQAGQIYGEHGRCVPTGGGANPCSLALANMTGANRVLVGVGWPLVVLVATWAATRHRRTARRSASVAAPGTVRLLPSMSAELAFLGFATLYSLTLALKDSLTLWDAAILVALFAAYAWRLSKAPTSEPDLIGSSAWIGTKPRRRRRAWVGALFAFAAAVILLTAEHFAESLVHTGEQLGVDEFLLVQWVAPLASESPELIVACLYAWRLKASESLGTLLSSKVNQWTLLVGTIPVVFAISSTSLHGIPLDVHQRLELLITAAQSLFAVAVLVDLRLSTRGAAALLVLFSVQFVASITASDQINRLVIYALAAVYIGSAIALLLRHRHQTARLVRDGTVTPFAKLNERDCQLAEQRTFE